MQGIAEVVGSRLNVQNCGPRSAFVEPAAVFLALVVWIRFEQSASAIHSNDHGTLLLSDLALTFATQGAWSGTSFQVTF